MIGNISSYASRYSFSAYAASRTHSTGYVVSAQKASQPQTPVQPVRSVDKTAPGTQAPKSFGLSIREGADPVEMAVRMRIKYVDDSSELEQSAWMEDETVKGEEEQENLEVEETEENEECQTCEKRKYRDGSRDPGVSFKTAAHIDPEMSASVVRGHEMEHVVNNRAKAKREDREIVSQSVTLHTSICPECGTVYTSGGTTTTVFSGKNQQEQNPQQSEQDLRVPFSAVA